MWPNASYGSAAQTAVDEESVRTSLTAAVLIVLASCGVSTRSVSSPSTSTSSPTSYGDPEALFSFQDPAIVESSGAAISAREEQLLFTHNDSGDTARFFAVDFRGCTLGRFTVGGATAVDWEDMARGLYVGADPTLWFADIGDNLSQRPHVTIYRVAEPVVTPSSRSEAGVPCPPPILTTVPGARFDLRYPDGAHDAETLLVHPRTGQVFVVTKASRPGDSSAVYSAPLSLRTGAVNVLSRVATLVIPPLTTGSSDPAARAPFGLSELVTGGDISPDAKRVVIRTYASAYEWAVTGGDVGRAFARQPTRISLPAQPQGEAITYTTRGDLVVTSEDPLRTRPPAYRLRRP
jgi:hypothetical protein